MEEEEGGGRRREEGGGRRREEGGGRREKEGGGRREKEGGRRREKEGEGGRREKEGGGRREKEERECGPMTLRNRQLTFLDADCTKYGLLPLLADNPMVHFLHQNCHTLRITLHDLIKLCKLVWNVYAFITWI